MVLTEAVKEVIWLRDLVSEFGLVQGTTSVFCDSQNAIDLSKNLMYH